MQYALIPPPVHYWKPSFASIKNMRKDLTQEQVRYYLDYCPVTGVFRWKNPTANMLKPGDKAGSISNGYIVIRINGHNYPAHRLAWLYQTGQWPKDLIDHIDGNPSNNVWSNLRPCNNRQNQANQKRTNLRGTCYHKDAKKFMAQIQVNGKKQHLGYYPTREQAFMARLAREQELGLDYSEFEAEGLQNLSKFPSDGQQSQSIPDSPQLTIPFHES